MCLENRELNKDMLRCLFIDVFGKGYVYNHVHRNHILLNEDMMRGAERACYTIFFSVKTRKRRLYGVASLEGV